jgi:PAS domain S-box-containing protein
LRFIKAKDFSAKALEYSILRQKISIMDTNLDLINPLTSFRSNDQFSELFNLEEIQRLQDLFADVNGVASIITLPDGTPITKPSKFTHFCSHIIRGTEKGCLNCYKSDHIIGRHNPEGPVIQICHSGGLWDAGAGITVGGKHIANWLIGQVRNGEIDELQLLQQAFEIGANTIEFIDAYKEVPVMSAGQFGKVSNLLFEFANNLSEKAYNNLQLKLQIVEQKKSIELLKSSEERLQSLFIKAPLGCQSLDSDGNLIEINQLWIDTLGYSREEVIGKWFGDFLLPAFQEGFCKQFAIFKAKGKIHSEFEMVHKNGHKLFIAFDGKIVYNLDGSFKQTHCILQDITEKKKLELERQVINEIIHGITTTDNLNELLKLIHQSLGKVLYVKNIFVSLYDPNTKLFSYPYFVDEFDPAPLPVSVEKSLTQYVFRTGQPLLMSPEIFLKLQEQNEVELIGAPAPSWIGVPLRTPTRTIGVLALQHYEKKNIYTEQDVQFLESVGSQIAIAIDRKQVEEDLRNERLLLRTVIDNIPDSIYCKDLAGRKTLANLTELSYSGVKTVSEIIGKSDYDLYPKELADGFFADDQLVLKKGKPIINREEFVIDATGQKQWLLTSKIPLKDKNGQIQGILGIGRNITNHRQTELDLRESEIKLKVILQSTADGILAIDGNGKIIKTNNRFAEIWQIPQTLIDSGDDRALIDFIIDQLTNPEEFNSKVQKLYNSTDVDLDHLHFKDGRTFERFSAPLILPNSSMGRVWSFRDITLSQRAELEIQKHNKELSNSNAEKDKFFSIIAHDLRNPIGSFMGLTKIMAEDLPSLTMTEIQEIAINMSKSATNLYRLLENLLQWSQIQKGTMPFNPKVVKLEWFAEESIETIQESANSKSIELVTQIPHGLEVFADTNMLQTVIRNLVSNAVKFTPKGGKVSLSAKVGDFKSVEISILDHGIGMSPEMVDNLFRLDIKTNRLGTDGEPSTGLGLLLCKEFIEKHGGKIWIESKEGKGSVFHFTLPTNKSK